MKVICHKFRRTFEHTDPINDKAALLKRLLELQKELDEIIAQLRNPSS